MGVHVLGAVRFIKGLLSNPHARHHRRGQHRTTTGPLETAGPLETTGPFEEPGDPVDGPEPQSRATFEAIGVELDPLDDLDELVAAGAAGAKGAAGAAGAGRTADLRALDAALARLRSRGPRRTGVT